jgi:hypothetical protein
MSKFKVGDKAIKVKGYEFPCTIVSVFETKAGNVRVVGEMDNYGLLHIFNEGQLEHPEKVSDKFLVDQYNRNRDSKDHVATAKEIPSNL